MLDEDYRKIEDQVLENIMWRIVKEKLMKEEVRFWSGASSEEARNTGHEHGVKIAGHEFPRRSKSNILQRTQGMQDWFDGGGRDEAAAKNGSYERYDKGNQTNRKNRCEQQLVGR